MRRRRTQQVVVAIIVAAFVLATVGLVGTTTSDDSSTPATTPPRNLDPAACDEAIEEIVRRLGASFDAMLTAGTESKGSSPSVTPTVGEAEWSQFFERVAQYCANVGGAVSEVIVFSVDRARETDDPVASLGPALTAEQLCQVQLSLTPEARSACASTSDLADLESLLLDDLLVDSTQPTD